MQDFQCEGDWLLDFPAWREALVERVREDIKPLRLVGQMNITYDMPIRGRRQTVRCDGRVEEALAS